MKYGLFGINMGPCADPAAAARVACAAEQAGFDSLWTGEHVVLPDPQAAPSPLPPEFPLLDPAVSLAWVAAHTRRVLLGTGIVILPQRNPVVLAKEMASLDVVSGGRLVLGVGAGYLEAEFAAIGASFEERGARTVEYLQAMQALWTQDRPAYEGRFVSFSGVQARPRPHRAAGPLLVMGGHTRPALRRAMTMCHGWYGFFLDCDGAAQCLAQLGEVAETVRRSPALGRLEISVTPPVDLPGTDDISRYARAGVDRLILYCPSARSESDLLGFIERVAAGPLADQTVAGA
jgi:probable F420-dependent oxidoreductase